MYLYLEMPDKGGSYLKEMRSSKIIRCIQDDHCPPGGNYRMYLYIENPDKRGS